MKSQIEQELKNSHSKATKRQLRRALRKTKKILRKLNRKVTITCKDEKGRCSGANAHTIRYVGRGVRVCSNYFSCTDNGYRAGVIVHELAHKAGANDARYFSHCSTPAAASPPANADKPNA